jgi:predicted AAA+ superfamily ATPase
MDALYYALNPWWEGKGFESGIDRPEYLGRLPALLKRKQIEVIVGSRRTGKTTLLKQYIRKLIESGNEPKEIFYLAMDHPSLSGVPVSEHLRNLRKTFMHSRERRLFLFLDEVQESRDWEIELKNAYDMEALKVFCTGSTSASTNKARPKIRRKPRSNE